MKITEQNFEDLAAIADGAELTGVHASRANVETLGIPADRVAELKTKRLISLAGDWARLSGIGRNELASKRRQGVVS